MYLGELSKLSVIQFGCGGTGSWLVPLVSKFLKNIQERFQDTITVAYSLIDGDTVEMENELRQNFNKCDEGSTKAMVLARQSSQNILTNFSIQSPNTRKKISKFFEDIIPLSRFQRKLYLVIGCVDEIKSRRALYSYLYNDHETPAVYIDIGNELHHGQTVTTTFNLEQLTTPFSNQSKFKNPKFYKIYKKGEDQEGQSCSFFGDQSQGINALGATIAFTNIQQILINNTLPPPIITFNSSGYSTFEI